MAFTFFYRDVHTLDHLVNYLIPEIQGRSRIKIWDAGCAMGPEPYTLAMILAEKMGHFSFKNLQITASDIDEDDTFGQTINNGIYKYDELKRIPTDVFTKYFSPAKGILDYHEISPNIKQRINFVKHNLLTLKPLGENYSAIVCKNVLLHLQPDERVKVFKMFYSSLHTGGLLCTEQTQTLPKELDGYFQQVVTDARLYRKI